MSLNQDLISNSAIAAAREDSASEVASTFLRHAVNVWAREHDLTGKPCRAWSTMSCATRRRRSTKSGSVEVGSRASSFVG